MGQKKKNHPHIKIKVNQENSEKNLLICQNMLKNFKTGMRQAFQYLMMRCWNILSRMGCEKTES